MCILQSSIVIKFSSLVCAYASNGCNRHNNQTFDSYVCPYNSMYSSDLRSSCGDSSGINRKYLTECEIESSMTSTFTSANLPASETCGVPLNSESSVGKTSVPWKSERYPCNIKRIDLRITEDDKEMEEGTRNIFERVISSLPNIPVVYSGFKNRNKLFSYLTSLQNLTSSPSGKND